MKKGRKRMGKALMIVSMNLLLIQTVVADIPIPISIPVEESEDELTDTLGDAQEEMSVDIPADTQKETPEEIPVADDKLPDSNSIQNEIKKLHSQTIPVGEIRKNIQGFTFKNTTIPSYICGDISYIAVSDLRQVGGNIEWNPTTKQTIIYDLNHPIKENPKFQTLEDYQIAYLARDRVYINYQEIPAIFVGGKTLIPAKWIALLDSFEQDNLFKIKRHDYKWHQTKDILQPNIRGVNIWFDGTNYIEEYFTFPQLEEDENGYYKENKYDLTPDYSYVGFVISEIDDMPNPSLDLHKAWLKNPSYYTIPDTLSAQVLDLFFPSTIIKGTMKYAVGGFKKGEQVIIRKAESNSLYYLESKQGGVVQVPWSSVSVKTIPTNKKQATKEQIEAYINKENLSSITSYFIWADIHRQRAYVFKGDKSNWSLIKSMSISSGRDITPTPRGNYTLNRRVPYFGPNKGYMAKNAYAFIGSQYLFHSVLFDRTGSYLLEGRGILGTKASQGCIRFSPEDSLWFYQTMPVGTSVYIN